MASEYRDIIDEHIRARDDGTLVQKEKKDMLDFMLLDGKTPSRAVLLSQIGTFVFAGHDTTASTRRCLLCLSRSAPDSSLTPAHCLR